MVASQATHRGVSHLGAAAGLRAQVTHLVLAAHSELSHPPRGRSRTSGSGHSLRSRRITPGSGRSPRSRRIFGLRPLTSVSQQDLGLRHSPRCRSEPRAQASHREPRGMANYAVRLRVAADLGSGRSPRIRSRMPSSGHPPRIRSVSFPSKVRLGKGARVFTQGHTALSSSRRPWHRIRPTKVVDTTVVHEKVVGSASVPSMVSIGMGARVITQGHAALSSSRRSWHHIRPTKVADTTFAHEKVAGNASVLSMVSLVMSARVVTQGNAALSSSRRSWHQKSSHEGRRHHCRLREGRRQSLRPIDGQPR